MIRLCVRCLRRLYRDEDVVVVLSGSNAGDTVCHACAAKVRGTVVPLDAIGAEGVR